MSVFGSRRVAAGQCVAETTAVTSPDTGATLRHARCCKSIHLKKRLRVMSVEIIALAERTEETDRVTFHGLIKDLNNREK